MKNFLKIFAINWPILLLAILFISITIPVSANGQVCASGAQANNIACSTNSECGTNAYIGSLFCQSGKVYGNYITYVCSNPGTTCSFCSNSTAVKLKATCSTKQICSEGACINVTCNTNAHCGTNGFIGLPFCQGNNVYKNYITYTCNNPGTTSSSCTNSTAAQLQTNCTANQTCSGETCTNIICNANSDCGTNGLVGSPFCQSNNVYQNYKTYTCNNPGTASSSCTNNTEAQLQTNCTGSQTCSNGSCSNSCTTNYQQRCSGSNVYWYDSCGNQGNLIQYCPNGCYGSSCANNNCTSNYQQRCLGNNLYWYDSCGNQQSLIQYCQNGCSNNYCQNISTGALTVTKTVKNLTTGTGFAVLTYASPSDMLLFMITLQATGQDVQNVMIRDNFPANLTYNNQLVVACSGSNNCNNSNYNYSGSIISGINLNTIYAGQTVTITYQAQVAPIQNFVYGTTTLTNSVYVTSSQSGYSPASNASVVVTKAGVLGASTISTGLTNNFWMDSFLLPLLITLICIGLWRSGFFFGIEKWVDNKKKIRRGYIAEKELSDRIASIKKIEDIKY